MKGQFISCLCRPPPLSKDALSPSVTSAPSGGMARFCLSVGRHQLCIQRFCRSRGEEVAIRERSFLAGGAAAQLAPGERDHGGVLTSQAKWALFSSEMSRILNAGAQFENTC